MRRVGKAEEEFSVGWWNFLEEAKNENSFQT